MALLTLEDVTLGYGGPPLLEHVTLRVERGERIALVGRNGAGKSTLMKLVSGELEPRDGAVSVTKGVRVARLVQEVPPGEHGSVGEVVAAGVEGTQSAQGGHDDHGGWRSGVQVEKVTSLMGLDPAAEFASLSSGMKRRVLLARALAGDPDVLLLDEPTNHLDIESITWLEQFLGRFPGTLVFVTHDRVFLRNLASRIVELDRGRLFDWTCDYETFLRRKEAALDAEANQQAEFDKKLAREEVWIRTGIKARRTRNEGRVRALEELRRQRAARREKVGNVRMFAQEAERSGRLVIAAANVSFGYGAGADRKPVVEGLSLTLTRGDKVGFIGPNGCGKTTLLKLLLGQLKPDSGSVRHGTNLEVAYFDQLRAQIDEEKTVQDNVAGGSDHVLVGGERRHIIGYLHDFLFSSERARSPARFLSGGERNRLLLAKMFTRPSNVLVLDEPTNDLDTETLELLEGLLVDYGGTVLLVSHDRAFLDNVTTSVLAFEGDGHFKEYDGGYDDWRRARERAAKSSSDADQPGSAGKPAEKPRAPSERPRRLSYKEERELESLPLRIEELEAEQSELHGAMQDPAFFRRDGAEIAAVTARLEAIGTELHAAYERWEALEALKEASAAGE